MPEFVNPFSGKVPERMLTIQELVRALRLDLAAEHEAVHTYLAHADATDNPQNPCPSVTIRVPVIRLPTSSNRDRRSRPQPLAVR